MFHSYSTRWAARIGRFYLPFVAGVLTGTIFLVAQPVAVMVPVPACSSNESLAQILALGAEDFDQRRVAAAEMKHVDAAMVERLLHARRSSDAEIARAAQALTDPATLDAAMTMTAPGTSGYSASEFNQRWRSLEQLVRLPSAEAVQCLVAVVRFESSEALSASAAVALIEGGFAADTILQDVRHSPRRGARWLRKWYASYPTTAEFVQVWNSEMERFLAETAGQERAPLADHQARLLRVTADRYWQMGAQQLSTRVVVRLGESANGDRVRLIELCDWLRLEGRFDCAWQLCEAHAAVFSSTADLLFRRAEILHHCGREAESADAAAQAAGLVSGDLAASIEIAEQLRTCGMSRWARLLLEQAVAVTNEPSLNRVTAWRCLSRLAQESGEYRTAADYLERALAAASSARDGAALPAEWRRAIEAETALCHFRTFHEAGDLVQARSALLAGLSAEPCHSELLIAARGILPDDKDWAPTIDELTALALQMRERKIARLRQAAPDDFRDQLACEHELASELNSWAWLASQTGQQLEQAEAFGRQALAIRPDDANVLDTLAACLNARGQFHEAVAIQQQAVQRAPWDAELRLGLARYHQARDMAAWQGLFR